MRVATAPVSYGVFELTVDGASDLPDGDALAAEMAAGGYVGTELGPPGFFGTGAEVARTLGRHGLALVGSFLPSSFSRDELFGVELARLDATLTLLAEAAGDAPKPIVLLSDAFCEPERMQFAGAIEAHPETWLDDARFATLVDNAHRAAERCRERGFRVSFHYHAGTYVETPREIARFAERMDGSLLGLCLDTGHSAFGGGDALDVLRDHGELVNHVHLKDVDRGLLEALHARGAGLEVAWAEGVFCRLGSGQARVGECLDALVAGGYDGWLVVEQDVVLSERFPFAKVAADARANREFLRARGY